MPSTMSGMVIVDGDSCRPSATSLPARHLPVNVSRKTRPMYTAVQKAATIATPYRTGGTHISEVSPALWKRLNVRQRISSFEKNPAVSGKPAMANVLTPNVTAVIFMGPNSPPMNRMSWGSDSWSPAWW
jgi:hypothetical protein